MNDLYSLALALLDRFPLMHFVTKAMTIIIIDSVSIELLHKLTENNYNWILVVISVCFHAQQARESVEQGHRMEAPESTPKEVYNKVMWECWHYEPDDRPTFPDIVKTLKSIISKMPKK